MKIAGTQKIERFKYANQEEKRQVKEMIEDVKRYFEQDGQLYTNQSKLGMKNLFRGMIVKQWVDTNQSDIDYLEYNKVFVKSCVTFYHECWKSRCVELHKDEVQIELLREQVKLIKASDDTDRVEGLHEFLNQYEITEEDAKSDELRNWIKSYRVFVRNADKKKINTLSACFEN